MSRFNTGNPLGSGSPLDLDDNAKNLDEAANSSADTFQDRLGKSRLTWAGIVKAGSGDPAIAVEAADRANEAADRAEDAEAGVEQNAEQIAQDAASAVIAGVDGQVAVAQNAADRAEAARDAAFVNADVYATVAEGRAAVEIGEQFSVVSEDSLEIVRYRKDGTSTSPVVSRSPASDALLEQVGLAFEQGNYAQHNGIKDPVINPTIIRTVDQCPARFVSVHLPLSQECRVHLYDMDAVFVRSTGYSSSHDFVRVDGFFTVSLRVAGGGEDISPAESMAAVKIDAPSAKSLGVSGEIREVVDGVEVLLDNHSRRVFARSAPIDATPPPERGFMTNATSNQYLRDPDRTRVTYRLPVKSGRRYTFIRDGGTPPLTGLTALMFDHAPSPGDIGSRVEFQPDIRITDGTTATALMFDTGSATKWIVYEISTDGLEHNNFYLYEGGLEGAVSGRLNLRGKLESDNIIRGKNLFDGQTTKTFLRDTLVAVASTAALSYIAMVEPGVTYTLSLVGNDRSYVSLWNSIPQSGSSSTSRGVRILRGQTDPLIHTLTFTPATGEHYILVNVLENRSAATPPFMQLEVGSEATALETYGYKFSETAGPYPPQSDNGGGVPSYGEGNALYIADGVAWADSNHTIRATDDTDALQAGLDSNSVFELEAHKKYLITRPLKMNPSRTHIFDGRMGMLVTDGDFPAIEVEGSLAASANPEVSGGLIFEEFGAVVTRVKTFPVNRGEGTGIVARKTFGLKISECDLTYMSRGIAFAGQNRNVMVWGNNIYANSDYGIHFEPMGDLHQINIFGNHISYSRKNIFGEDQALYNIQITGNDIETSTYPVDATHNIHFVQTTKLLHAITISGNMIEDHSNTNALIKLEGMSSALSSRISQVTIAGNSAANSADNEIEIGGAVGVDISGQFKDSSGYTLVAIGDIYGLKLSVQKNKGGLFKAVGNFELRNIKTSGCQVSGGVNVSPIFVDVSLMRNCDFSGSSFPVTGLSGVDETKGLIHLEAPIMELVRADNNTIDNSVSVANAIKIVSESSVKGSMVGNMSRSGSFSAPTSFTVSGNT